MTDTLLLLCSRLLTKGWCLVSVLAQSETLCPSSPGDSSQSRVPWPRHRHRGFHPKGSCVALPASRWLSAGEGLSSRSAQAAPTDAPVHLPPGRRQRAESHTPEGSLSATEGPGDGKLSFFGGDRLHFRNSQAPHLKAKCYFR